MTLAPLTITERAILANQFKILSLLDKVNSTTYLANVEIFENGYAGLYSEALQGFDSEISKEVCTETHDILNMYRYITNAVNRLTPAEKKTLALDKIAFDGFDGNNDDHYHFASFMIERQGKYKEHLHSELNSHSMGSMIRYKKMLPVYKSILEKGVHDFGINELQLLISAV